MAKDQQPAPSSTRRLTPEAALQLREIAHELRNPLNALTAITEIFRDQRFGPLPTSQYVDYADLAHQATQRMLQLCERLVVEDPGDAAADVAEVGSVIVETVRLFEPMAADRGVTLSVSLCDELPKLEIGREPLASALNNLIANAIKFTPKGGSVTVATRSEPTERMAVFVVSDTGIGMDPEELAARMEPDGGGFPSTTGVHGDAGTGLGLSLVKRNVHLLGGTLELRSKRGVGTCAIIRIPLP